MMLGIHQNPKKWKYEFEFADATEHKPGAMPAYRHVHQRLQPAGVAPYLLTADLGTAWVPACAGMTGRLAKHSSYRHCLEIP